MQNNKTVFLRKTTFTRSHIAIKACILMTVCFFLISGISTQVQAYNNSPVSEQIDATHALVATNDLTKTKYTVGISYVSGFPIMSSADIEDRGFGWAILQKFAESANIEFEYVAMPVTRLQPSMDSGAVDFIFPDNPHWTSYRSNRLPNIFSGKLMSGISSTFVRAEKQNIMAQEISKVAIPFGYTAGTWMKPIQDYNIKAVPVRDLRTALFSVTQGSTDAADVEYNTGRYLIEQDSSLSNLSHALNLPHRSVAYHLSSIKHITILEDLTAFIKNEAAMIEALKQQYNMYDHDEVYIP